MKSKQLFFFAEGDDFKKIISEIESANSLHYVTTGLFDSPKIIPYPSLLVIPNYGNVLSGDWNHINSFLALPSAEAAMVREVPQKSGGSKYAVDQKINPVSIVIKPGGIYKDGVLVAGSIGTISNNEHSNSLFNAFQKLIKKNFSKIGAFYVGASARERLDQNWRLVTNDKSPREYDLKN